MFTMEMDSYDEVPKSVSRRSFKASAAVSTPLHHAILRGSIVYHDRYS